MKVRLVHESGLVKEAPIGFSWTTLFFCLFVPLIRGDLKMAMILLMLVVLVSYLTDGYGSYIPGIIFAFTYNKMYIKSLLEKGYKADNEETQQLLILKGIILG